MCNVYVYSFTQLIVFAGMYVCTICRVGHFCALSLVHRSTQLDTWTWVQLRAMQVGGNASAVSCAMGDMEELRTYVFST